MNFHDQLQQRRNSPKFGGNKREKEEAVEGEGEAESRFDTYE